MLGLKERVLVQQEEEDILVFQFKNQEARDRAMNGGPWCFNNIMLLMVDYDDVSPLICPCQTR